MVVAAAAVASSWALRRFVWRPRAMARMFRAQGVRGQEYRFLLGNMVEMKRLMAEAAGLVLDAGCHDYGAMVQPYYRKWMGLYGRTFVSWFGEKPALFMGDVSMVKQVYSDRTGLFPKESWSDNFTRGLGKGMLLIDGDEWKRHRKVINPVFSIDMLKTLAVTVSDCVGPMLLDWEAELEKGNGQVEIEISHHFDEVATDVISHVVFGRSHREAKEAYLVQKNLQSLIFSSVFNDLLSHIPGLRNLPTKSNLKMWKLEKEVKSILINIIESRLATKDITGYGEDMLGVMLETCTPDQVQNPLMSMEEIMEECKTFYIAGHETTSLLLTWAVFLLSTHQEWQEKLREEVERECGKEIPTSHVLSKLKLVNMFILETLRLYSPAMIIQRKAGSDLELGGIKVTKDTILTTQINTIHTDKDLWGDDVYEFKPMRFENGVVRAAKHPNAFMAFSIGPRACIGQNFTMIQAKVVLAIILQRFSFSLSPKYVHAPKDLFTLKPRTGMHVVLKTI
ncbi:cytochrome P450 709B2-like [Lolium rigidum]|uniref:cytochrome P450 709B2-like n=1 Tax=Lolium rigidum TaxID=89674 RepID=UPI001F5DDC13|nr:cytochrome P450 709B2-like [Lolium rigidum]